MTAAAAPSTAAPPRDAATIGSVSVAHGLSHFCQLVVPPLFPWIGAGFALSNTQLGLLLTVFYVVSSIGQTAAGFAVDRYGAHRVLFGGLGCLGVAALGLAAAPSYAAMLPFMALAGLGNCVFHPVDFSILNARIGVSRLGHAYAVHGISGNVGWALAPLFVVGIAQATGSWRLALLGVALLVGAVALLLWVWRAALAVPVESGTGAGADGTGGAAPGSLAFLRVPAVWFCFAFFLTFAISLGGLQSFAPAAAGRLHGLPAAQFAICLSAYMGSAAVAMLAGGRLVRDPSRSARVVALGFGFAALTALAIGLGDWPAWSLPLLFGAMGAGTGIAGPSRDLLVKQATPAGATGRVYGVVYSGLDVGMALAPLLFGTLMDGGQHRGVWIGIALAQGLLIANAFNLRRSRRAPKPLAAGTAAA